MSWAKNEPIDEEARQRKFVRDTQIWGARAMRAISQLHRMPPRNDAESRAWSAAARIVEPKK